MSSLTVAYPVTPVPRVDANALAACLNEGGAFDLGADPANCTVTVIFRRPAGPETFLLNLPMAERLLDNDAVREVAPAFLDMLRQGVDHIVLNGRRVVPDAPVAVLGHA